MNRSPNRAIVGVGAIHESPPNFAATMRRPVASRFLVSDKHSYNLP